MKFLLLSSLGFLGALFNVDAKEFIGDQEEAARRSVQKRQSIARHLKGKPTPPPSPPSTRSPTTSPTKDIAQVTVGANNDGDYNSLSSAISAGESDILMLDGVHVIPSAIQITSPNISIQGQSKSGTILRKSGPTSLLLIVNTENITIRELTLDARTFDSDASQIWEAVGCVNCQHTTLADTIVYGSDHMFAIFFAGPTNQYGAGQATIDAFDANLLDDGNVIENNMIYSNFPGDVLSFSLQRNGRVTNNRVVGGMISFFMNKDSSCNGNTVSNSNSAGIFVSVPAENNLLDGNTVYNSRGSGMVVRRQIDHVDSTTGQSLTPTTYRAPGIILRNNNILGSRFMGLEVDQTIEALVEGNTITSPDFSAVYSLRSNDMKVVSNTLEDFGQCLERTPIWQWDIHQNSGVYFAEYMVNSTIQSNNIVNATSSGTRFGAKIGPSASSYGNYVVKNRIVGTYTYAALDVPVSSFKEDNLILSLSLDC
jgi:hypothetical protein